MAGVTVREAGAADAPQVLALLRRNFEFDGVLGTTYTFGTDEGRVRRTLFGPQPFARALLAEAEGAAVGLGLYYFQYSSFAGRPSLWLEDLFVDADRRGRGVGAALLARVARAAQEADCTHLGWTTHADNARALAFYRRHGAEVVGREGTTLTLRAEAAAIIERADGAEVINHA